VQCAQGQRKGREVFKLVLSGSETLVFAVLSIVSAESLIT
jgi:hypothetical protein